MICSDYSLEKRALKAPLGWKEFKTKGKGTPSELSLDFLSRCLVPQEERMDWKELRDHPIFKEKSNELPNNYEISVMSISELDISELIESESITITTNVETSAAYFEEKKVSTEILKMDNMVGTSSKEPDDMEEKIYKELVGANLNCLKANYIYINYIIPLEKWSALDMSNRNTIELMYLLSCRCFLYVSRIRNIGSEFRLSEKV